MRPASAQAVDVPAARRWAADPLLPMVLLGVTAATLVLGAITGQDIAWWPPALVGVVAAGLALSGST